jgi:DNA-binding NarL/FixJ family response regulator
MKQIRLLCVDDHAVVRQGIALMVNLQPDMTVVASATTGEQAVELYRQHKPDVTLMDLQLPRMSGVDAILAIRKEYADARIVVLTMYHGDEDIYRAVRAGAMAYLTKDMLSDDLVRVIREVHAEGRSLEMDRLAERTRPSALTDREMQVIELLARGMRNKEIATELGISEQTARVHMKNILAKLHVSDRAAALSAAARRGIVHIS